MPHRPGSTPTTSCPGAAPGAPPPTTARCSAAPPTTPRATNPTPHHPRHTNGRRPACRRDRRSVRLAPVTGTRTHPIAAPNPDHEPAIHRHRAPSDGTGQGVRPTCRPLEIAPLPEHPAPAGTSARPLSRPRGAERRLAPKPDWPNACGGTAGRDGCTTVAASPDTKAPTAGPVDGNGTPSFRPPGHCGAEPGVLPPAGAGAHP